jgi:DNA modification methylase
MKNTTSNNNHNNVELPYRIINGDSLSELCLLDDNIVDVCITSPPYFGLRNYGNPQEIGAELELESYIANLVTVFTQVHRVLSDKGTLWIVIGDSYGGSGKGQTKYKGENDPKRLKTKGNIKTQPYKSDKVKPKDLIGVPWELAFALRNSGWYLRNDIIWHKPNAMPQCVYDRCVSAHEYVFMFSKIRAGYYFNHKAIMTPSKTQDSVLALCRDVWSISTSNQKVEHPAPFPLALIQQIGKASIIKEGCTVLDPFCGSGTTGVVALQNKAKFVGIELNKTYADEADERLSQIFKKGQ